MFEYELSARNRVAAYYFQTSKRNTTYRTAPKKKKHMKTYKNMVLLELEAISTAIMSIVYIIKGLRLFQRYQWHSVRWGRLFFLFPSSVNFQRKQ